MNIQTALRQAVKQLKHSSSPALDAEVLLAHVLKKDHSYLFANPNEELTQLQTTAYQLLIQKRRRGWPVAYLTGHKEFFGLDFVVTPDVLVPRPETELLVERTVRAISEGRLAIRNVIDVGTGSGNIIVSLAKSLPSVILRSKAPKNLATSRKRSFANAQDDNSVNFYAIDSSRKALRIAKLNARRHGVSRKIKFLRGNLLSPFLQSTNYRLPSTLIIANLPYLTPKQYHANPDLWHEPKEALVGGPDGLKYFRGLFQQLSVIARSKRRSNLRGIATRHAGARNDNNLILLEHDPGQKNALAKLLKTRFPRAVTKFYKDLSKRYRAAQIQTRHLTNFQKLI